MAFGGGISLLALIAAGAGPAVNAPATMRVDFDAPAGCSSAEAFRRGVAARMDHPAMSGGALAFRVQVRLTRSGNRVTGELRLTRAQSAPDTRTVEGASCDEVVDVLALTTALALQPAAPAAPVRAAPREAPAPSSTARTVTRESSAAGPSPRGAGPGRNPAVAGGPASSPAARAAREAPPLAAAPAPAATARVAASPTSATPTPAIPPTGPPAGGPPTVTTTPTPPTPVAPGAAAPQSASVAAAPASGAGGPSIHVDIGAGAAGARILSSGPAVNLGSALMVGLARGRDGRDGRVAATLRLAWIDLPNDLLLSPGQVVDRLNAFVLTACPGWGARRGPFEAQACARGIGGWLTATDRDVSNARAVSRSWWSAGALLRGRATLGGGFSLELEAGVDAPLADRQFITTTPLRTVATTPPLSVLVGVGLSRRL